MIVALSGTRVYEVVKRLLVDRGWNLDTKAEELPNGELREFIHPATGKHIAWIDALLAQQELET